METEWTTRRQAVVSRQAAALAAVQALEQAQAHQLLMGFVRQLQDRGVAPEPLLAAGYSGGRYRTQVTGWYLRANASLGVDAQANYYVLQTPGGWRARFQGARLRPTPPPLVVGRGGRDGESIDLKELIAVRLAELTPA